MGSFLRYLRILALGSIGLGLGAVAYSLKSVEAKLAATPRPEPPPIVVAARNKLADGLRTLLPKESLKPADLKQIADRGASQLLDDLQADPEKAKIFEELVNASKARSASPTPETDERMKQAAEAALPLVKGALEIGAQAASIPLEAAKRAQGYISELKSATLSGLMEGLVGGAVEGLFERMRKSPEIRLEGSSITFICKHGTDATAPPARMDSLSLILYFDVDAYQIAPERIRFALATAGIQLSSATLRKEWHLEAHTDRTGTESHNRQLAEHRGDSVRRALVSMGVPNDRIHVYALAETLLPAPTSRGVSEPVNRIVRLEIK